MKTLRLLLVLLLAVSGFTAFSQTNEPRSRIRQSVRPKGVQAAVAVAPPVGFPSKLVTSDQEYLELLRTNAKGARVTITFEDGKVKTMPSHTKVYGYSQEEFRRVRDGYIADLRTLGYTNEVAAAKVHFVDNPGNSLYAVEKDGAMEETLAKTYLFDAPFASQVVVQNNYPELFEILGQDTPSYAKVQVSRAALGESAPSSSITVFTSKGESVAYGLQTGEVYPTVTTISLIFDYVEEEPILVPQVRISGPPGTWVRAEEKSDLGSQWSQVGDLFQLGDYYENVVQGNTENKIGFFRVTPVPPPVEGVYRP